MALCNCCLNLHENLPSQAVDHNFNRKCRSSISIVNHHRETHNKHLTNAESISVQSNSGSIAKWIQSKRSHACDDLMLVFMPVRVYKCECERALATKWNSIKISFVKAIHVFFFTLFILYVCVCNGVMGMLRCSTPNTKKKCIQTKTWWDLFYQMKRYAIPVKEKKKHDWKRAYQLNMFAYLDRAHVVWWQLQRCDCCSFICRVYTKFICIWVLIVTLPTLIWILKTITIRFTYTVCVHVKSMPEEAVTTINMFTINAIRIGM